jgi:Zn-finger protein
VGLHTQQNCLICLLPIYNEILAEIRKRAQEPHLIFQVYRVWQCTSAHCTQALWQVQTSETEQRTIYRNLSRMNHMKEKKKPKHIP